MRAILILFASAVPATAHPGHLIEVAGHDHWLAGVAIGAAAGVAIWGWLKGGDESEAEDVAPEDDAEGEEAPA